MAHLGGISIGVAPQPVHAAKSAPKFRFAAAASPKAGTGAAGKSFNAAHVDPKRDVPSGLPKNSGRATLPRSKNPAPLTLTTSVASKPRGIIA